MANHLHELLNHIIDSLGIFCPHDLAAMITDGCYQIDTIVAVWRDENTGKLHVLPPCGTCRDFMRNIDQSNLEANVILGKEDIKKLKDLIPYHEWPKPLEGH